MLTFFSDKYKRLNTIRINSIYALISNTKAAKKTEIKIAYLYLILILYKTFETEKITTHYEHEE